MLLQQTLDQLYTLKLNGMREALEEQLQQPDSASLGFEQRIGLLVDREVLYRDNRRHSRLLSAAKLRVNACVEDINYRHPRGLERSPWFCRYARADLPLPEVPAPTGLSVHYALPAL